MKHLTMDDGSSHHITATLTPGHEPAMGLAQSAETLAWETGGDAFPRHSTPSGESHQPFVPGETVSGRFDIVRKIGEGGMGVVYEAFDRKRKQKIAIKSPKAGYGPMLSPELEGALKVRHPNVCLVNEIHTARAPSGDFDFLTMELLHGETLADALSAQGKLCPAEAREIARQLCAGLKEAHRSGVIHRDLKAGNVILCRAPGATLRAVITDFGLSGEAGHSGFFGTQRYMAPELLLGQKATKASDIFALGVILYEMVNGLTPEDAAATGPVPAHVSRAYQKLLAGFLSIQPEKRYRAFDSALEKLGPRIYSRRHLLAAGMSAACALVGGSWLQRETIANWLQPLPKKRFVALLAWPPILDLQVKPIVDGAIDAIENELVRAESADHDLLIVSAGNVAIDGHEPGWLEKLGNSLGVNLALQTSAAQGAQGFELLLRLVDISTGAVLRHHQVLCAPEDLNLLSIKAVESAAGLLNVRWDEQGTQRLEVSTDSAAAHEAFQAAEELRKKPNDDGLPAAIESYAKAIEADSRYTAAYARLAMAYIRLNVINRDPGALELARANAEKANQLNPRNANAHLASALVFDAKGDLNNAVAQIRLATELDPTNPRNLAWLGQIYNHFQRWQDAERVYRRLQKERPNYWVSYNDLGVVLGNVGRYQEAIQSCRVAVAAAPQSTLAFSNLALFNFKAGNIPQAEQNYRRSIAIKPTSFACLSLGEALRVQGKFAEALANCKQAVNLMPSEDENWLGLADCYEAMGGRQKFALEAFQEAALQAERNLQVDPSDGAVLARLALYRMKTGEQTQSMLALRKADSQGPLDIDSDLCKARVLELAGKRKDALDIVASCLRRGPVGFQVETTKDLTALTRDPEYARILKRL